MSGQKSPDGGEEEKKKKYHGEEGDYEVAREIYKKVVVVNQTVKEPNWDAWANEVRLMREIDGRGYIEILRVFDFANRDPFWSGNILSPGGVRRFYPTLAAKAGIAMATGPVGGRPRATDHEAQTCGDCFLANKGRAYCRGQDAIPDHPACINFVEPCEVVA